MAERQLRLSRRSVPRVGGGGGGGGGEKVGFFSSIETPSPLKRENGEGSG